ncbi:TonB-dependent siderophore receptor [Chryseobacterium sp. SC28]|uniref:TonB-dependent siderophore receptor n=1 Tax=Chryseobacterium sp. SC28 TaxID=2268028 RepID=UPI000F6543D2|nr:TonB-dependent receptor [Chryseobacterium sp. SC28]RRQ45400.1 TonB-dependent receptor [Chryseobacterium sp. SC28]
MIKRFLVSGCVLISLSQFAQKGKPKESDTIKIQQIEDVALHKTDNPNRAKISTSKSNLTTMENPQPISIVTHEIIEQQQMRQLSEVIQNVNGLYVTSSRGNSQASFGGRGFTFGSENIFKNGARINSGVNPEVSGLERVEVLKGATALLYGNVAAGGIINMITKKPLFKSGGTLGFSAGSWDVYKPTVDFYGPLTDKIAFRVNGTYEKANSFRDVVNSEKYYFNPSFAFNIGSKTQIIVEADYLSNNFTPDFGLGTLENPDKSYSLNTISPISTFFGTEWQYQKIEQAASDIILNHQFNEKWTLNAVVSYQNYTKDYFSTERTTWTLSNNRYRWRRNLNRTYNEQNYNSAQVNLNGEFSTGKVNHKILMGADADYLTSDSYTYYDPNRNNAVYGTSYYFGTNGDAGGYVYLDDPNSWKGGMMPSSNKYDKTRIPTRRIGFYAQDFISLTEKWKVLAGLRYSYLENKTTLVTNFLSNSKIGKDNSATADRAFSPKAGLVFVPNDNLSLFATYTNSFSPNTGRDVSTDSGLQPSIIDQFEVGIKKNIWRNAVAFNITAYQILNRNFYQQAQFLSNGEANSDANIKEFAGQLLSRGVEADITGNPSQNLSLIAGFSYNHAVYKDTPELFGYVENQRAVRTPATTVNGSVFYTFDQWIKGLKVGGTYYFIGDRLAGWNDTKTGANSLEARNGVSRIFKLKDYNIFDLSIGYECKKFLIQGKIGNLFDTENYTVHENYSVNPIMPRNYYLTLSYKL